MHASTSTARARHPLRIAPMDSEIRFAAAHGSGAVDTLFRDFVLPMASPGISKRLAALPRRKQLEGFPLLHLDFYKDDPAVAGLGGMDPRAEAATH